MNKKIWITYSVGVLTLSIAAWLPLLAQNNGWLKYYFISFEYFAPISGPPISLIILFCGILQRFGLILNQGGPPLQDSWSLLLCCLVYYAIFFSPTLILPKPVNGGRLSKKNRIIGCVSLFAVFLAGHIFSCGFYAVCLAGLRVWPPNCAADAIVRARPVKPGLI